MKTSLRFIPVVVLILLWQTLSSLGFIPENRLPPPIQIIAGIKELLFIGMPPGSFLVDHIAESLKRVISGLAIAILTGLALGIFMSYWRTFGEMMHPVVEMLRPIPPLAWVPISILWFGIGNQSASFIIFLGAFFPILLNTISGVLSINQRFVEAAVILGAKRGTLFFKVLLPGAMPSIITGIRIGIGIAWMTLVAAEFTGVKSGHGLGYMIMTARDIQRADLIVAGMAVIGLIGYLIDLIIRKVEQRLLRWV